MITVNVTDTTQDYINRHWTLDIKHWTVTIHEHSRDPLALGAVGFEIRLPRSYVIEEDDSIVFFKSGRDEAPHVLVTTKAMSEHHRLLALTKDLHIVSDKNILAHVNPSQDLFAVSSIVFVHTTLIESGNLTTL